jgi:hypothetical protein
MELDKLLNPANASMLPGLCAVKTLFPPKIDSFSCPFLVSSSVNTSGGPDGAVNYS